MQTSTIVIYQDNQSTIALMHNTTNTKQTKHIDIAYHHIHKCIDQQKIKLHYCPTSKMIADALTKPLAWAKFEWCRNQMGIQPLLEHSQ